MKRFIVLLGLASLTSLAAADRNLVEAPAEPAALVITSKPVPLNKDDPKQLRVGELIYRGGLELRSPNKNFGGISGLRLWDDTTVLAVSDTGSWISFKLVEKKGRLIGVKGIAIAPVLDGNGNVGTKADRDVESVAIDRAADGTPLRTCITLERSNARWCFADIQPHSAASLSHRPTTADVIDGAQAWPVNGGPEAADISSRWSVVDIVISEEANGAQPGTKAGLMTRRGLADGHAVIHDSFSYPPPPDFKATDIEILSDTAALVLNRHYAISDGVAASITELPLNGLTADSIVQPREIARLAPPLTVDNMEGISYVERKGRKYIYIISDDNFSGLQRTLLMKFEWVGKKPE